MLVDSSVLIDLLRDKSGEAARRLRKFLGGESFKISRVTQFELLRGCNDERSWEALSRYLDRQDYVECCDASWAAASRIYFELCRKGRTLRSSMDCCIAQAALKNELTLVHNDRDFEIIAEVRPLMQARLDIKID
jgi:predicted nucleic acid-binding protein